MTVHGLDTTGARIVLHSGSAAFGALRQEWETLAAGGPPSPYVTHAWLAAFLDAFGDPERVVCPAIHGPDGDLRAAACLVRDRAGGLATATNEHSGDWDVVAADDAARAAIWRVLVELRPRRLVLSHLVAGGPSVPLARAALADHGLRVIATPGNRSPYLRLPGSYDELVHGLSRNMRSQVARRGRQIARQHGELTLRTVTGGPTLDRDLDALFAVEASGWKAREGTAILHADGAERAYRAFAHGAAERGWLRLYLLEAGGRTIAGDLGCAIGDTGFLIKTGFDEDLGRLSPGLVLRGKVLEASIAEGLAAYDFLGPDDGYKLRWTSEVRPRVTLRAYRGAAAVAGGVWWRAARPALKDVRNRIRRANGS